MKDGERKRMMRDLEKPPAGVKKQQSPAADAMALMQAFAMPQKA